MPTTHEDRPIPSAPVPASPQRLIQAFVVSAVGYAALVQAPFPGHRLTITPAVIVAAAGVAALAGALLLVLVASAAGRVSGRYTSSIAVTVCGLGSLAVAFTPNVTTLTLARVVVLIGAGAVLAIAGAGTHLAHLGGLVLGAPTIHVVADAHGRSTVFTLVAVACASTAALRPNVEPLGSRVCAPGATAPLVGYALLGAAHGATLPHLLTQHHDNAPTITTLLLTTYCAGAAFGGYTASRLRSRLPAFTVGLALTGCAALTLLMPGTDLLHAACLTAGFGLTTQAVLAAQTAPGLTWATLHLGAAAGVIARAVAVWLDLPVFGPAAILASVSWLLITSAGDRRCVDPPSASQPISLNPAPQWPLR